MKQSVIIDNKKLCPKCSQFKEFSDFGVRPNGKIRSWCKPCGVKDTANYRIKTNSRGGLLSQRFQRIMSNVAKRHGKIKTKDLHILYKKQNGKCYYTGVEMILMSSIKNDPLIMSIDRIDSSKPYSSDNCVLCCLGINHLKNMHSISSLYQTLNLFYIGAKQLGKF